MQLFDAKSRSDRFRVNGTYVLYVVDRYYLLSFGDPDYQPIASD